MQIAPAATVSVSGARFGEFAELTKPRITFLVLVTTAVGYALGLTGGFSAVAFLGLLVGTAFVSGGASALNQYLEREADGRMLRTRGRPIPSGRVTPGEALLFGLLLSAAGLLLLGGLVNLLTFGLGATALASYVFLYTPLKRVTSLCTLVGAVPGAIPPLMGWAAARGSLDGGAWALFAVLFLWQLPHFLAIGWIHRDDYARGGFPMLAVTDPDGASTGRQSVLYSAALLPVTLLAGALASSGTGYLWSAVLLGGLFLGCAVIFSCRKTVSAARWLFLVSVLYLPVLLGVMVFDR
jgi:protoheme IX farnesyltransferase